MGDGPLPMRRIIAAVWGSTLRNARYGGGLWLGGVGWIGLRDWNLRLSGLLSTRRALGPVSFMFERVFRALARPLATFAARKLLASLVGQPDRLRRQAHLAVFAKRVGSNSYVPHRLGDTSPCRKGLQALLDLCSTATNLKPAIAPINPHMCRGCVSASPNCALNATSYKRLPPIAEQG